MLSTKKKIELTRAEKDEKINNYRLHHKDLLEYNNAKPVDFNVKVVFTNNGQKVIGVFPNEFTKPNGFYLEFVDSNLDPTDPSRTVYVIKDKDNFEDIYNVLPQGQYAMPIEDLDIAELPKKQVLNFDANKLKVESTSLNDDHFSKMTIKDFAAIMWQSGISDKPWLNNLIEQVKANI